jgi:hypothetical protein
VVAAIIGTSAGARTQPAVFPAINIHSNTGIAKFLSSHGIDPKGVVVQRGAHNYAGPSCPGVRWTCTTAKHVVQISFKANDSQFECTPSSGGTSSPPDTCVIIQDSVGGTNDARCTERTNDASASQSCVIFQSNTTGDNHLQIQQRVDANGGATQAATQYAGVVQTNVSGSNDAQIAQDLKQSTKDTGPGGTQTQDGHQSVSVTQTSDTGDNRANVDQSLALHAEITGNANSAVSQSQNTTGGLNTNAGITQDSTSGSNDAHLNQSNDLNAHAPNNATGSQTQGSLSGGLNGFFSQDSTGVSSIHGSQHEHQQLSPEHASAGLSQTQYGPAWYDPNQGSNPADSYNLDQHSDQHASDSAFQSDAVYANCDTTGNCDADQHINQNGNNEQNSCSGPSCHIGLIVTTNSEGSFTSTCSGLPPTITTTDSVFASTTCPTPPPPPPPPFRGCEAGCLVIGDNNLSHG